MEKSIDNIQFKNPCIQHYLFTTILVQHPTNTKQEWQHYHFTAGSRKPGDHQQWTNANRDHG